MFRLIIVIHNVYAGICSRCNVLRVGRKVRFLRKSLLVRGCQVDSYI